MTQKEKEYPAKDYTKTNEEENKSSGSGFVLGAIIGGVVGAATALFMAPKTGKELRSDLNEQAKTISEKTEKLRQAAIEKGSSLAETAKEKTGSVTQLAKEKTSAVTQLAVDKTNTVKELAKDKTSSVTQLVSEKSAVLKEKVSNLKSGFDGEAIPSENEESENLTEDKGDVGYQNSTISEVILKEVPKSNSPEDSSSESKNTAELKLDETKKAFEETESQFGK